MNWNSTKLVAAALAMASMPASAGAQSGNATPTCSDVLGIDVHGQHVIGDYVSGLHGDLGWPPDGSEIGEAVGDNRGVAVKGGPGPGFHFEQDPPIAPGASFCTDSQSPGWPH